jgi:LDH2 family malate/lactate/ureidoglycolate dehydrogenase
MLLLEVSVGDNGAGAAPDFEQREPRIARAFEDAGIAEEQARRIASVIIELVRANHPAHG